MEYVREYFVPTMKDLAVQLNQIKNELFSRNNRSRYVGEVQLAIENWLKRFDYLMSDRGIRWYPHHEHDKQIMSLIRKIIKVINHIVPNKYVNDEAKEKLVHMRDIFVSFITFSKLSS